MKIATDINNKIVQITTGELTAEYNTSYLLDENPFENWEESRILSYCYLVEYVLLETNEYVPVERIYPYRSA